MEHSEPEGAAPERRTTRFAAQALRRQRHEAELEGSVAAGLIEQGDTNFNTGAVLAGAVRTHVAHAWDACLADLTTCLVRDSGGDLDWRYSIDLFSADLLAPPDDPVATVQRIVAGAKDVLLVIDEEALALKRLWVLFEALLASDAGKLRARCSAPSGFGSSEASLRLWEERIDSIDWVLAMATRKSDDKRLRNFAEKVWEVGGKGVERMLAQMKKQLRREIYGEILVGAVEKGDKLAVKACLEAGASPEQQDAYGNTVEELASHHCRQDIEDLLFEQRMKGRPHSALSDFFAPEVLVEAAQSGEAHEDVLFPFLTQAPDDDSDSEDDDAFDKEFRVLGHG